ncbi:MAG TPA: guanine deaminase [Steroidobacteraceae bacterium]|nr:guanine deaminase [Steroidobacteraceae bacterium]
MASQLPAALRGAALTFVDDPLRAGVAAAMRYEPDAIVAMADGHITHFGPAGEVAARLPPGVDIRLNGAHTLMLPGFIDCHVHYPQIGIIGAGGKPLLDWLNEYTFVAEQQFADAAHAREVAQLFLRECLRAGTTTAAVFCTVHPQSVDAFFAASAALNTRMIAGKVLMDRHAPAALTDGAQRGYDESKALIGRWHARGRQLYAVTPRFAASSTPEQMAAAGALWAEHPGTYLQSHVAENRTEVSWIRELYPERRDYLDVYDHYGQLGPRAIFGHGVWLGDAQLARCHDSGTALAHCPTSNQFLGSGAFDLHRALDARRPVRVGMGTDLGAGTSFSMLRTLGQAYGTARLLGNDLGAPLAFYLATRGGARALHLEDRVGSLAPGLEADLVVLDLHSTPSIEFRMRQCASLEEALFVQMTMGDERAVRETWVAGVRVHARD